MIMWCFFITLFFNEKIIFASCNSFVTSAGYCWPVQSTNYGLVWHGTNKGYSGKHLGLDIIQTQDRPVYAIADGVVLHRSMTVGDYGGIGVPGGAMIIRHKDQNGVDFTALYGHVKNITTENSVKKGDRIADVGPYVGAEHLHLGIRYPFKDDAERWAGYSSSDKGFVDVVYFLNSIVYKSVTEQNLSIYWTPANTSCVNAKAWCYGSCSANFHNGICQTAYNAMINLNYAKFTRSEWYTTFFGSQSAFDAIQQCSN